MGEKFDKSRSSYIMYLDANNLYGWALSQELATHGFKWMSNKDSDVWRNKPCIIRNRFEVS